MAIRYNPNNKEAFYNDIANSVKYLRSAAKEMYNIWNGKYPQTAIGRKFNNARAISKHEAGTEALYKKLISVEEKVEFQIELLMRTEKSIIKRIFFSSLNSPPDNLDSLSYEELRELFLKTPFNYKTLHIIYEDERKYRYSDDPLRKNIAWITYDLINEKLIYETGVSSSDVLLNETFPLDDNYKEITDKTENMMKYLCKMENTFKDSSQCQGAIWIGEGIIAVCDIDGYQTDPEGGWIKIFRINPNDPEDIEEICVIENVMGHSNDIGYIPSENCIIHPNDNNGQLEVIYLDEDYKEIERKNIAERKVDAVSYDKENDAIVTLDFFNGDVYSKEDFLEGKESKNKFMIPDAFNDEENGIYYNQRGGSTAKDGKIYVCYTGYKKDKRSYDVRADIDPDIPQSNMVVVYDSETGKCEGRIINNSNGEVESIAFDDNGDLIWILNCNNNTYIVKSDMSKVKKK